MTTMIKISREYKLTLPRRSGTSSRWIRTGDLAYEPTEVTLTRGERERYLKDRLEGEPERGGGRGERCGPNPGREEKEGIQTERKKSQRERREREEGGAEDSE